MKKTDVPFYNDPDSFEILGDEARFPCDTQFMSYNPMLHRYYLTVEALQHYGLDAERRYISSNPNKVQELIEKASKKVYDYIQYKAGRSCYQIMLYRIATAPTNIYPDQYYTRKQFEEALVEQARYIIESGDSAKYSNFDIESSKVPPAKPEEALRDTSDIAPETIRTLETLGLTRWFKTNQLVRLDLTKF